MVPGGDRASAFASASLVRITQAESSLVLPRRNLTPATVQEITPLQPITMQSGSLGRFEWSLSSVPAKDAISSAITSAISSIPSTIGMRDF